MLPLYGSTCDSHGKARSAVAGAKHLSPLKVHVTTQFCPAVGMFRKCLQPLTAVCHIFLSTTIKVNSSTPEPIDSSLFAISHTEPPKSGLKFSNTFLSSWTGVRILMTDERETSFAKRGLLPRYIWRLTTVQFVVDPVLRNLHLRESLWCRWWSERFKCNRFHLYEWWMWILGSWMVFSGNGKIR